MRVRAVGADALLLEVDDPAAWFAELWRRRDAGELAATEIVPGACTVLLDGLADPAATGEAVRHWTLATEHSGDDTDKHDTDKDDTDQPERSVEIAVTFDGPDLSFVAGRWDTDEAGVVERLTRTPLHVAFCGFSPGFAYLAGLPPELAVPRLETPRHRVPAGSVALADTYTGIYPTASPGGWRLVGHTDAVLFDADRDPPALLTPSTRVRLVQT
jgi:KipI family sensor histidine kinase inhibitor